MSKALWPRNAWYQAAWSHEIGEKPLARTLLNQDLVIYRDVSGTAHILEDRCCHRGLPLSRGRIVKAGLECGYHGLIFNGCGACIVIPGQDSVPPQMQVRGFSVIERQGIIWVWMGEKVPDESLLVDFAWHDNPKEWPRMEQYYPIRCDYRLLIDNLMDLTHIPYVHRSTIGSNNPSEHTSPEVESRQVPRGAWFRRWMKRVTPPLAYQRCMGWSKDTKIHRWHDFTYLAPCSILQGTGAVLASEEPEEARDRAGTLRFRIAHGIVPETEISCHYFWSTANGAMPESVEITKKLFEQVDEAFREDLELLEAQQQALLQNPGNLHDTKHDKFRIMARKALEELITAESAAS